MRNSLIKLALVATTSVGLTTQAALHFQWNATGWFLRTDHETPLLGDDISGAALAQLIFSPDPERGRAQQDGTSLDRFSVADDVVLFSRPLNLSTTVDGLGYAQFGFLERSTNFVLPGGAATGVVWIRVFDAGNQVDRFIHGSLYLDSPLFTIGAGPGFDVNLNNNPADRPPLVFDLIEGFPVPGTHDISTKFGMDPGSVLVHAIDDGVNRQESWTVAPEPGTLAFLGLGAVAALLRRRRS